jgi:parallel beta-helix repeat protein
MIAFAFCMSAILILLVRASPTENDSTLSESPGDDVIPVRVLAYTPHDPIYIDGNAGFTNASGVVWGSGTESDPYVIVGWEIGSFPANGIEIGDTDVHFVIQDCFIHDGQGWGAGISLNTCSNGTISNCTCLSDSQFGVYLSSSRNISVMNTTCTGSWNGISLELSANCSLINNNCSDNYFGITLSSSDGNLVTNCSCYDWQGGVDLYSSSDNSVLGSKASEMSLNSCLNTTLSQNEISGLVPLWGDTLDHFNSHSIDTSNTVKGAPFYYYKDQTGIAVPSGAGEIVMANCSDMRVEGQSMSNSLAYILLAYCTGTLVSNNTFPIDGAGVELMFSDYNLLAGNLFRASSVWLHDSDGNRLMDNSWIGGSLSLYSSNNCGLVNNTCTDNEYGVRMEDSDGVSLIDNNFSLSIYYGVELDSCDSVCMTNNTVLFSGEYGIVFYDCVNATLRQNILIQDGIFLGGDELGDFDTHSIDTTNTANGKPIYYYKNETGITIPAGAGQVLMANCTDMRIENQNLSDADVGVELYGCTGTALTNNNCSNGQFGILIMGGSNNSMNGNTCGYDVFGIAMQGSPGNSIADNDCSHCSGDGIYLMYSDGNELVTNICSSNTEAGIRLYYSSGNSVIGSTCSYNSVGIYMYEPCNDNIIQANIIDNNTGYGIYLGWGMNNRIWDNSFTYNNGAGDTYDPAHVQASSDAGNWWNTTEGIGNFWSDWTGPDANTDGIVDDPYVLDGGLGVQDNYPLATAPEPIPEFGTMPFVVIALLAAILLITGARRRKAQ